MISKWSHTAWVWNSYGRSLYPLSDPGTNWYPGGGKSIQAVKEVHRDHEHLKNREKCGKRLLRRPAAWNRFPARSTATTRPSYGLSEEKHTHTHTKFNKLDGFWYFIASCVRLISELLILSTFTLHFLFSSLCLTRFFHFLKCFDYSIEIPLREENCTDGLGD